MKKKFTFITLTLLLGLFTWNASAQVTVAGSASGNGSYSTIYDAITAIPLSGQSGNNITVELSGSTTEVSAITIGAGTWSSLKIYPTSSDVICTEVAITLSGASHVTIDGRRPAAGNVSSLTLSSNSTTSPILLFDNDAQIDTVKYCTIKIGAVTTTGGIAFGANAATTNGNGLNVIDNNLITSSGASYPFYAIYADGNTLKPNKGNQITNNWFTNFMSASGSAIGIYILGNATSNINDNYTISGNSMYGGVTTNSGGNRFFMQIGALGNGGSHTITGNYIGGSSANCGGSKMTKIGTVVSHFSGIALTTSATGTSLVQNNRIKNISWTTSAGTQNFTGISVSGTGDATISGNSIGDNSTSGYSTTASIIYTITGTTAATFIGIGISSTGTVTCDRNQIGSIKTGNTAALGTGGVAFTGIFKSVSGTTTISNNIIGSLTAPYSINDSINNTTLYNQNLLGINLTGTGIYTVENNTIANISNMATGGTSYGIQMNGTGAGTNTANANLIHSISVTGATSHIILGISSSNGTNLITNNIIKLGDNIPAEIRAIQDATNSVSTSGYHNTVYVSGNPSSGGALKSTCLSSGAAAKIRNYKNNIFVNTRFNSGLASGAHSVVAINVKSGTGTISLNGNDYYFSGTSAVLGNYGATLTLPFLSGEASLSVNPSFANAGGTNADDFRATNTSLIGVTGTSVTNDYAGAIRRVDQMGAFFRPTSVPVTGTTTNPSGLTAASQLEVAAGAELIFTTNPNVSKIILAPTAKLTMGANTITAPNGVVLQSDATGTATFTGDAALSNATVQQYVSAGRNWYLSAPLTAANATVLNRGTSVVEYNEATGLWPTASTLTPGKGYIQVASSTEGSTGTVNFSGTTNSGNIAVALTYNSGTGNGFNLVGNPYPSYLSWSAVFADNALANMPTGTMWYRTISYNEKNAWLPNTAYSLNDIVYNGTRFYKVTSPGTSAATGGPSGTTTAIDNTVTWAYQGSIYIFATVSADGQVSPSTVSNLVPPMQAFWVKSTGGTLTFKNAMRSHKTDVGSNVLKAPKSAASEMPLLRLSVTNGISADEAVIYASANALNAFDSYDAPKLFNTASYNQPEIFTQAGNEKLAINALSEISEGMELPLGFATAKGNNFSIAATELKNLGSNMQVILKDKQSNNAEFNLTNGQAYNFSSIAVNDANRFSLLFRAPGVTTGIDNATKLNAQVFVNSANQIAIVAPANSNYAIYNAMGQQIENGILNTKHETRNAKLNAGVYVVKVNNQSTRVIIK